MTVQGELCGLVLLPFQPLLPLVPAVLWPQVFSSVSSLHECGLKFPLSLVTELLGGQRKKGFNLRTIGAYSLAVRVSSNVCDMSHTPRVYIHTPHTCAHTEAQKHDYSSPVSSHKGLFLSFFLSL